MILINTDKDQLDIKYIHQFLVGTYWAANRTIEQVQECIENSLCFGVYKNKNQIGFARILTDKVAFSYLLDVFIDNSYQGNKYGEKLLSTIYKHPALTNVKSHYLITDVSPKNWAVS